MGGAKAKGKSTTYCWFGNGAKEPRLEVIPVGQEWGPLKVETAGRGIPPPPHSGYSETLATIPAVLERERQLGLAGWRRMGVCWGTRPQLPTSLCVQAGPLPMLLTSQGYLLSLR